MISATLACCLVTQAPPTGQALLDDLSRKAVDFFYQQSHPVTGFTKDRAANLTASDNYTVASIASTGFALSAMVVGAERGWIARQTAQNRARVTAFRLRYMAAKDHGWYYHFINWSDGSRVWNCEVSSIDTSIMLAGLLTAERYFQDPQITADTNAILAAIDWNWMLTNGGALPTQKTFCMGWLPESGFINSRWGDYSEQMMLLIQALGAWQNCPPQVWSAFSRPIQTYSGIEFIGGGPLFLHQMSHSYIDFENKRDKLGFDYWIASRRATLANRQFCINNPHHFAGYGPLYWGLSACDGPDGYAAFGGPVWGDDNGTIAPASVAASIPYAPEVCQPTLDSLRAAFPQSYGRYGFSNGINQHRNWIGPDVVGIDLGMMMCAIENKRDRLLFRYSKAHPVNAKGMRMANLITQRQTSLSANTLWKP